MANKAVLNFHCFDAWTPISPIQFSHENLDGIDGPLHAIYNHLTYFMAQADWPLLVYIGLVFAVSWSCSMQSSACPPPPPAPPV